MADFSAVLRKTIDGLSQNTPEMRARVYDKARATVESKLAAVTPPPSAAVADRQRQMLEDAITAVEADYAEAAAAPPPPPEENEFDRIFAEYDAADDTSPAASEDAVPGAPEKAAGPPPPQHDEPAAAAEEPFAPSRRNDPADPAPPFETVEPAAASRQPYEPATDDVSGGDGARERTDAIGPEADDPEGRHAMAGRPQARPPRKRKSRTGLVAALVLLVVLGGAAYGVWLNKTEFAGFLGLDQSPEIAANSESEAGDAPTTANGGDEQTGGEAEGTDAPEAAATTQEPDRPQTSDTAMTGEQGGNGQAGNGETTSEPPPQKFTQRLTPEGEEVDEGPANGNPSIGEGTSVATATQASGQDDASSEAQGRDEAANDDTAEQTVPVGQRAIFYEERTNADQGSAKTGSVVWSLVQESPGNDLPPEPAIRAEATIPSMDVQLRMTIRRNADPSLPASHIVEMIFLTPDDFEGGGIENVLRVAMKQSEEETGNPLLGVPAKIADGFFLIALNDTKADVETNRTLLRRQEWIDVPIVYKSGRRALITLQKGIPGDKVFEQALEAWQSGSSG